MPDDSLTAFFNALREDPALRENLARASSLDEAVALGNEAGFSLSKADWLKNQGGQATELSDEELAEVAGGMIAALCAGEEYWWVR